MLNKVSLTVATGLLALANISVTAQSPPPSVQEVVKIVASDAAPGANFGSAVAFDQGTIVVGAPTNSITSLGAVYVFEAVTGNETMRLTPSIGGENTFGDAVSLQGDVLLASDTRADSFAGAVYVFERDGGGIFQEVARLLAADRESNDKFGSSTALDGSTLVIGASGEGLGGGHADGPGAAYVFEHGPGGWSEAAKLVPSDGDPLTDVMRFGHSVALDGSRLLVGAPYDPNQSTREGAAYLFERDASGWMEVKKLVAPTVMALSHFGHSVALAGSTAFAGAPYEDSSHGAVYVFERDAGGGGNWGDVQRLLSASGGIFGWSLALAGDTGVIGALDDGDHGAAFLYRRNAGVWAPEARLVASDVAADDQLGNAVAFSGSQVVVGARLEDHAGSSSGSAYLFELGPSLTVPQLLPAAYGSIVEVPVELLPNGHDLSSVVFSIDYDEACLDFDPTDADADGIPDAFRPSVPSGWSVSVALDLGDPDGEIDVLLYDLPPDLALPPGPVATIELMPTCEPVAASIVATVGFSPDPSPSFGDLDGHSVPGLAVDGSVEILPGLRGDCNSDSFIDAGDISACALEIFDGDGSFWLDAPGGTFAGSPVGCDSNADTAIDAGDVSCTGRLIFDPDAGCGAPLRGDDGPRIEVPDTVVEAGLAVVPVVFQAGSSAVNSLAFGLRFDPAVLGFDPTDANGDGIPDAVAVTASVSDARISYDPASGQLNVLLARLGASAMPIDDGPVLEVTLAWSGSDSQVGTISFAGDPAASFGDVEGRGISGTTAGGRVMSSVTIFSDGFETGDLSGWSSVQQ